MLDRSRLLLIFIAHCESILESHLETENRLGVLRLLAAARGDVAWARAIGDKNPKHLHQA